MNLYWKYGNGSRMGNVCYLCTDRHPACQSTCEKYLAARAEHDRKTAEAKKKYLADKDVDYFRYNSVCKYKKRMRK